MKSQPVIIKVLLSILILLVFGIGYITYIVIYNFPKEITVITAQGDELVVGIHNGPPQIVTITDRFSEEALLPTSDLYFNTTVLRSAKDSVEAHLCFVKEENGCRYYEIAGKEFVVYSSYSPHIVTEDGHWYQLRFIHSYDLFHCRPVGWKVYMVEYSLKQNKPMSIINVTEIGLLADNPEFTEEEVLKNISGSIKNQEHLRQELMNSSFLKFKNVSD